MSGFQISRIWTFTASKYPLSLLKSSLENAAAVKQKEADDMAATIFRLEKSINSYKEEYAQLISQAEAIKTDLKHVQVNAQVYTL
jgi:dynein heavy chain 1